MASSYGTLGRPAAAPRPPPAVGATLPPVVRVTGGVPATSVSLPPSGLTLDVEKFQWVQRSQPWALLGKVLVEVGKIVLTLLILYYALLTQKEHLMACDRRRGLNGVVVFACEYTKAYLRAFPLLALNVALLVALRTLLQTRIYYGLLRARGLLDFVNGKQLVDPLLWLLVLSLGHGCIHFLLKMTVYDTMFDMAEYKEVARRFVLPSMLFMVFFYKSGDVEQTLVPLNKYMDQGFDWARNEISQMTYLDERVVRREVINNDIAGDCRATMVEQVYASIIGHYAQARLAVPPHELVTSRWSAWTDWAKGMWPAKVLLDSRLEDPGSKSFRCVFYCSFCVCFVIEVMTFLAFLYQAGKDIFIDFGRDGRTEDVASFLVTFFHAVVTAMLVGAAWSASRIDFGMGSCRCFGKGKE